jgi:hypothetical protein
LAAALADPLLHQQCGAAAKVAQQGRVALDLVARRLLAVLAAGGGPA